MSKGHAGGMTSFVIPEEVLSAVRDAVDKYSESDKSISDLNELYAVCVGFLRDCGAEIRHTPLQWDIANATYPLTISDYRLRGAYADFTQIPWKMSSEASVSAVCSEYVPNGKPFTQYGTYQGPGNGYERDNRSRITVTGSVTTDDRSYYNGGPGTYTGACEGETVVVSKNFTHAMKEVGKRLAERMSEEVMQRQARNLKIAAAELDGAL